MTKAEDINVGDFFMYEDFNDNGNMIHLYGLVVSAKNSFHQGSQIRKVVFLELDGTLCPGDYHLGCTGYDLTKIAL
jgi:hypothetical protein